MVFSTLSPDSTFPPAASAPSPADLAQNTPTEISLVLLIHTALLVFAFWLGRREFQDRGLLKACSALVHALIETVFAVDMPIGLYCVAVGIAGNHLAQGSPFERAVQFGVCLAIGQALAYLAIPIVLWHWFATIGKPQFVADFSQNFFHKIARLVLWEGLAQLFLCAVAWLLGVMLPVSSLAIQGGVGFFLRVAARHLMAVMPARADVHERSFPNAMRDSRAPIPESFATFAALPLPLLRLPCWNGIPLCIASVLAAFCCATIFDTSAILYFLETDEVSYPISSAFFSLVTMILASSLHLLNVWVICSANACLHCGAPHDAAPARRQPPRLPARLHLTMHQVDSSSGTTAASTPIDARTALGTDLSIILEDEPNPPNANEESEDSSSSGEEEKRGAPSEWRFTTEGDLQQHRRSESLELRPARRPQPYRRPRQSSPPRTDPDLEIIYEGDDKLSLPSTAHSDDADS